MPIIKSSADLRNDYNGISNLCHEFNEPVFITKNGKGDLAVMSIETYEKIVGKLELYSLLQDGLDDIYNGNTVPMDEAMNRLKNWRK